MAFLELINLRKARKAIAYLVLIVVTIWLQTMVFSRVRLLNTVPFFVPALIVAIGMFEGGVWGGMLGLAAGLGCMLSMAGSPVLFLVLLPVFGFLSGLLADFLINRSRLAAYSLAAEQMHIPCFNSAEVTAITNDKYQTYLHLHGRHRIPMAETREISRSALPGNLSYPLVAKPADGHGGAGVAWLRDADALAAYAESVQDGSDCDSRCDGSSCLYVLAS